MKFVLGKGLTLDQMQQKASEGLRQIEEEFIKLFGTLPLPDEIAYACTNKRCGWWDDSYEDLMVVERLYRVKEGSIIVPGKVQCEVQMICPKCQTWPIKAVKREILEEQARESGNYVTLVALKNRRTATSLHPA